MEFRLIHVVEPDTSAASGREGRYEAYTLDFSFFIEPRLRGIEHVEFWRTDEQRRRRGVREAPVYELHRVSGLHKTAPSTEALVDEIVESLGEEPERPDDD